MQYIFEANFLLRVTCRMTQSIAAAKAGFAAFRDALYDSRTAQLAGQLGKLVDADAAIRLAYPLGDTVGADGLLETGYLPLLQSIPDLERRDVICIGAVDRDEHWIVTTGHYVGVMEQPWLGIPATRHLVALRYIECFRIVDHRIVTARMLWDIPSLMMQAEAWPMAPSLGVEILVPGPATQDGIIPGDSPAEKSAASMKLVNDMVEKLGAFADGGADAMQLESFWHPNMNWYGPAGIGSCRRLSGFRNWHQVPFLRAMPDRRANTRDGSYDCYFADGDYVAFCGWPAMDMTVSADGWLGMAPARQKLKMASLDIWRCENGRIRENWVLIDMLDIWRQVGVDVLARMRELTFDRQPDAL